MVNTKAFDQMSIKLLLILMSNSFYWNVTCQEMPPILVSKAYEAGIYMNYLEFLTNSPSIKQGFTIRNDQVFYLDIKDKSVKKQVKNFWGVSDGKSIYISSSHAVKGSYTVNPYQLALMMTIDRYCLFVIHYYSETPYSRGLYPVPFAMNINNGVTFPLKKEIVKKMIGDDIDLLNEYEDVNRKNNFWVKADYILTYNKTNQHEINFNKSVAKVVVYRRAKDSGESVIIRGSDGNETILRPNAKVVYLVREPNVKLCANNNCITMTLSNDTVTYIQCFATSGKLVALDKVSIETGNFYVREIDFYSKKKQ